MRVRPSKAQCIAMLAVTIAIVSCGKPPDATRAAGSSTELVLLSREGCANTGIMRARVADALRAMQRPADVQVLDLDTLPSSDVRRGYPTPTLLYADHDVFGLAVPKPPLPEPT